MGDYVDAFDTLERPDVKVSKPRYSESNLNPGIEITLTGCYGEVATLRVTNGNSGLTIALDGKPSEGSGVLVYLFGTLDTDDQRTTRERGESNG